MEGAPDEGKEPRAARDPFDGPGERRVAGDAHRKDPVRGHSDEEERRRRGRFAPEGQDDPHVDAHGEDAAPALGQAQDVDRRAEHACQLRPGEGIGGMPVVRQNLFNELRVLVVIVLHVVFPYAGHGGVDAHAEAVQHGRGERRQEIAYSEFQLGVDKSFLQYGNPKNRKRAALISSLCSPARAGHSPYSSSPSRL